MQLSAVYFLSKILLAHHSQFFSRYATLTSSATQTLLHLFHPAFIAFITFNASFTSFAKSFSYGFSTFAIFKSLLHSFSLFNRFSLYYFYTFDFFLRRHHKPFISSVEARYFSNIYFVICLAIPKTHLKASHLFRSYC